MLLIVDSEKVADIVIKQSFEELGFQTVVVMKTAANAKLFIQENKNISMLIINSTLDDADGSSLCQEIRKTETGRKAYIFIVVSSVENKTAIDKAYRCGADEFTVKPYNGVGFKKRINQFISDRVVILVEDDAVTRMMVESIMSEFAVEIIAIDDGIKAYNMFNAISPVKLVILDIGLPNMNGIQLIKRIRSKPDWKKTAVVMLTGSTDSSYVKESLGSGANDYIAKPFKIDGFLNRIKKYLPDAD